MSEDHVRPIYVAILGTDAVLAARPVDPVQLTRACQLAGFDFVVPVSWGEELIAAHLAGRIAAANGSGSVVAAVCPLAREQLAVTPVETSIVATVSPPIATARYIRAAFRSRPVHVTFVGGCPGARDPEIDVHCLPEALFTRAGVIHVTRCPAGPPRPGDVGHPRPPQNELHGDTRPSWGP